MTINLFQAALLGFFSSLSSMPGMGGTTIGNYTLGRPLVGGLVAGLILGDVRLGITVGAAIQIVYIALITPGGAVAADSRAISYIGVPLAMVTIKGLGIDPVSAQAVQISTALGAAVGTVGTVLYYGTVMFNLVWQRIGLKAVNDMEFEKLYWIDMGLPWIGHIFTSFIPTALIVYFGPNMVDLIKAYLPMDGFAMKVLFTVGSLLPAVGIGLLLNQIVTDFTDMISFLLGFTFASMMGVNLIGATIIGAFFGIINYRLKVNKSTLSFVNEEEEI